MSKIDLNLYLAQLYQAYESAKETLADINDAYTEGAVTEEDCIQALEDFEKQQLAYETVLICVNHLNKPSNKKKHRTDAFIKSWYNNSPDWIKDGLYDENINVLQPIINKFKELKNGKSN